MILKQVGWVFLMCCLFGTANLVYAEQKGSVDDINTLILQGETFRQKGHLRMAEGVFSKALSIAKGMPESKHEALTTGLLGNIYLQQHRYAQAIPLLEQAMAKAKQHPWPELAALHANYLGNYYSSSSQGQAELARAFYKQSLEWALKVKARSLVVQARLNLAQLANDQDNTELSWALLTDVNAGLDKIKSDNERVRFLLQMGYLSINLKQTDKQKQVDPIKLAYQAFTSAFTLASQSSDRRSQSLSQGYLGKLYETQQRFLDALVFTDQAVDIAQRIDAKELLLKWEWQRGRLLKALGQQNLALAAYRRAVNYIEAVRQDIPVDYQQGRSSFRETLEPVYLGLADLLLQQARHLDVEEMKEILQEARQTVELIKKTELEDYFHNRCAIQSVAEVNLEEIAPQTATIYPIILPDRLELLIGIGNEIHHRTVPVVATEIRQNARSFARKLRRRQISYKQEAQQLYSWLLAPLEDLLKNNKIDTLVIVPDGELRLVPFAALFNGSHYLIEQYAVVTSPGLTLFDPQPINRQNFRTLLAGLSKPGPVIKELPLEQLQNLVTIAVAQTERSLSNDLSHEKKRDIGALLFSRSPINNKQSKVLNAEKVQALLDDPVIFEKCQMALELPGVEKEINALSELLPSTYLINETFVKKRLKEEILTSPFQVVHIASHGVFGHSSDQSFIMTYDKLLTFDQFESLLVSEQLGDKPIELLTLSACQTAEGDDRASLGMSGIAIKAKVRSVLGTLWSVSDKATVQLMTVFYQQLKSVELSKAQALQQAQLVLLNDKKRHHPYYWSPFILVGNWL